MILSTGSWLLLSERDNTEMRLVIKVTDIEIFRVGESWISKILLKV